MSNVTLNLTQSPEQVIRDLILKLNQNHIGILEPDGVIQYTFTAPEAVDTDNPTKTKITVVANEDSKTLKGSSIIYYDRLNLQHSKILALPNNYHISHKLSFGELRGLINDRLGLELTMNDWIWPDELQYGENTLHAHPLCFVTVGAYTFNLTFPAEQ